MAPNKLLIALTCVVVLPGAALAQAPARSLAARADCCATATDGGTALARSVLLPASLTLPTDDSATALAVSVLLPAAFDQAMADMGCCNHHPTPSAARPEPACHQEMTEQGCCTDVCCKEGCEMPCGQSVPPTR